MSEDSLMKVQYQIHIVVKSITRWFNHQGLWIYMSRFCIDCRMVPNVRSMRSCNFGYDQSSDIFLWMFTAQALQMGWYAFGNLMKVWEFLTTDMISVTSYLL